MTKITASEFILRLESKTELLDMFILEYQKERRILEEQKAFAHLIGESFDYSIWVKYSLRARNPHDPLYRNMQYLLQLMINAQEELDGTLTCDVCSKNIQKNFSDTIDEVRCEDCAFQRNQYL